MDVLTLPFTPRLEPFDYQATFLAERGLETAWMLPWEQGCGKSKAVIDNAALLLMVGKIDGMLVLAPGGVHRNWVVEELPTHWPKDAPPYRAFCWDGGPPWGSSGGKGHDGAFRAFLAGTDPVDTFQPTFGILTMSYDQMMTDAGRDATWKFLKSRKALYVADESHRFKTPSAARQKRALASSVYAPYRRAASGTPMDKPFDLYSQVRWLDANFWVREMGIGSFAAFKAYFGNWKTIRVAGGRMQDVLDKREPYRRLDELWAALQKIGTRVTLDATKYPRVYKRIVHPLSPAQRAAHVAIKEECMAWLASGHTVTAEQVFTQELRMAQIASGFVGTDEGVEVPFKENPRADYVREWLAGLEGAPAIIWGRFKFCVATAMDVSRRAGRRPVLYASGNVAATLDAWKAGEYDDLIAPLSSSMTEGYTLTRAHNMAYYSNSPRLITRQQSEARIRRPGQSGTALYTDFLAERTRDRARLERLHEKGIASATVLGDDAKAALKWLVEEE